MNHTGTTLTPAPTDEGPNTVTYEGWVLTSPTAYLSFAQISADSMPPKNQPGSTCGGVYVSAILPVDPKELYSYRDHHILNRYNYYPGTVFPFDLADLNTHTVDNNVTMSMVPADVYLGQDRCGPPYYECPLIRDDYRPDVVMPESVRVFDALWSSCDFWRWAAPAQAVALDQFVALKEKVQATVTDSPSVTSVTPGQGLGVPVVTATARAMATEVVVVKTTWVEEVGSRGARAREGW